MAPMPNLLCSPAGEKWLLLAKLKMDAFRERENGLMFARTREVEEAYAKLSPADFVERFGA